MFLDFIQHETGFGQLVLSSCDMIKRVLASGSQSAW